MWKNGERPPNEKWVEVKSGDGTTEVARAVYGRDGLRPHWETSSGTLHHPSRYDTWRHLPSGGAVDVG